jgi:TRAP-type C4-dicarboxylate transport system permease small subunit
MDGKVSDSNPIDRLSVFLGEKISYVFLVSVVITAYEVVMRYGFNAPTTWVHDGATALSATGFLMAGCYVLQQHRHIAISVVYDAMPPAIRKILDVANSTIIVAFLALLTWAAMKKAQSAVAWGKWDSRVSFWGLETSAHAWDVPIPAYLKTVLLIGTTVMLLQALVHLWVNIHRCFEKARA